MNKIISLIGPRTVGKTTIGKELSLISGYKLIDIDQIMLKVLKNKGKIFGYANKYGWNKYFEKVNKKLNKIIKDNKNKNMILDLGGGTIAANYPSCNLNAKFIKKNSTTFLILPTVNNEENIKILFKREKNRNKSDSNIWVTGWSEEKLNKKVKNDYVTRISTFKKYANFSVYTKYKSPKQVAKNILKEFN